MIAPALPVSTQSVRFTPEQYFFLAENHLLGDKVSTLAAHKRLIQVTKLMT